MWFKLLLTVVERLLGPNKVSGYFKKCIYVIDFFQNTKVLLADFLEETEKIIRDFFHVEIPLASVYFLIC